MDEFNLYEYTVKQKIEGAWRWKRAAMIALYVLFVIMWFIFGAVTNFWPLLALIPVTLWMVVFFTWRYVSLEYEYSILSGDMTVSNIYGGRSRKQLMTVPIKKMTKIAPWHADAADDDLARFAPTKEYSAVSSMSSPDVYYALFVDPESDEHCVLWFEATERALKVFRFYNAPATVITKVRF